MASQSHPETFAPLQAAVSALAKDTFLNKSPISVDSFHPNSSELDQDNMVVCVDENSESEYLDDESSDSEQSVLFHCLICTQKIDSDINALERHFMDVHNDLGGCGLLHELLLLSPMLTGYSTNVAKNDSTLLHNTEPSIESMPLEYVRIQRINFIRRYFNDQKSAEDRQQNFSLSADDIKKLLTYLKDLPHPLENDKYLIPVMDDDALLCAVGMLDMDKNDDEFENPAASAERGLHAMDYKNAKSFSNFRDDSMEELRKLRGENCKLRRELDAAYNIILQMRESFQRYIID